MAAKKRRTVVSIKSSRRIQPQRPDEYDFFGIVIRLGNIKKVTYIYPSIQLNILTTIQVNAVKFKIGLYFTSL